MNKFWRVENADGGHNSTHLSYLQAVQVARTRATMAPQETFILSEAMLIFRGDAPAQAMESVALAMHREGLSAVSEVSNQNSPTKE
jgi:hypothetical protein